MHSSIMATCGGSGALSNAFSNYLNPNDQVLIPDYMWGNYKQIAYENFASYTTYKMFDGNHFNLNSVKEKIYELKKKQGRVVLVINDPCHNPTGYTMSYDEWCSLVDIINESTRDNMPFILIYDMAYIDYDMRGFAATRKNFLLFKKFNESVLTILAFSGSKTLALYGMRIGAEVALSKSKEVIEEFNRANKFSSRAKWSSASNIGMNIISKVILNEDNRTDFEKELKASSEMLTARAKAFLDACNDNGVKTLPFSCGFFITIPCEKPQAVYEKLVEKKIHIIPLNNSIRVTISAINLETCKRLPIYIKEVLNECE